MLISKDIALLRMLLLPARWFEELVPFIPFALIGAGFTASLGDTQDPSAMVVVFWGVALFTAMQIPPTDRDFVDTLPLAPLRAWVVRAFAAAIQLGIALAPAAPLWTHFDLVGQVMPLLGQGIVLGLGLSLMTGPCPRGWGSLVAGAVLIMCVGLPLLPQSARHFAPLIVLASVVVGPLIRLADSRRNAPSAGFLGWPAWRRVPLVFPVGTTPLGVVARSHSRMNVRLLVLPWLALQVAAILAAMVLSKVDLPAAWQFGITGTLGFSLGLFPVAVALVSISASAHLLGIFQEAGAPCLAFPRTLPVERPRLIGQQVVQGVCWTAGLGALSVPAIALLLRASPRSIEGLTPFDPLFAGAVSAASIPCGLFLLRRLTVEGSHPDALILVLITLVLWGSSLVAPWALAIPLALCFGALALLLSLLFTDYDWQREV